MKTLTPKLPTEEKPQKTKPDGSIGPFTITLNLVTLFVAMGIAYMMLFPIEKDNKNDAEYQAAQLRQWSEVSRGLAEVKTQLAEVKKAAEQDAARDANWQKMSKGYHMQLLVGMIKNKIIAGDDFKGELEELNKFGISQKDPNFQVLHGYAAGGPVLVNAIISNLYDEATSHKDVGSEGFIDSVKHFFTNLFTVKKVDEHKIHATSNEITSIIVQLLLDGRIEAAYTVASKFHGAHANITKIADTLKPASDALNAASKLEVYG